MPVPSGWLISAFPPSPPPTSFFFLPSFSPSLGYLMRDCYRDENARRVRRIIIIDALCRGKTVAGMFTRACKRYPRIGRHVVTPPLPCDGGTSSRKIPGRTSSAGSKTTKRISRVRRVSREAPSFCFRNGNRTSRNTGTGKDSSCTSVTDLMALMTRVEGENPGVHVL